MYRKRYWCVSGEKVVLVPYCPHHVKKYHHWMQDPLLRSQTASAPLTLDQEYEMQQTWIRDEDKCTFIVISKELYDQENTSEIDSMAGDINLFFSCTEDPSQAEIEIMIAEPSCRGKGLGLEATQLMMAHGIDELNVKKFSAKIGFDNGPSLRLFQDKLGFIEVSRSSVFQEVTLELIVSPEVRLQFEASFNITNRWTKYSSVLG